MMVPYALVGLCGAFTSTDAVHLRCDRCPASLPTIYTGTYLYLYYISYALLSYRLCITVAPGKEGFPTVAYNCSVYHDGSFAYNSAGTSGSANDKL